jgi:hypothetical protein
LTSSQWLDVDYGFKLQSWILLNFKIIAILESSIEPWFVGARVTTAATILEKCDDEKLRYDNIVRFVQLHRPLAEVFGNDGTSAGAVLAADDFRDKILALNADVQTSEFRARLVKQEKLVQDGIRVGNLMKGESSEEESDEP